jgi:UPF0271 protein
MKTIDLNCDVGEGIGNEADLMPYLSSCNIACGLHAGDDQTMKEVVRLAIQLKLRIGAHPSFNDRANFGRVEMEIPDLQLKKLVYDQVVRLQEIVQNEGGTLAYVKPHGALYNMAARSQQMSTIIIDSLLQINADLRLMGLAGSAMQEASKGRIGFIAEGFADRKYASNVELKSRNNGGLITDFSAIEDQLRLLLAEGAIMTDAGLMRLDVHSLCLHGDTPGAVDLVSRIHDLIVSMGVKIAAS